VRVTGSWVLFLGTLVNIIALNWLRTESSGVPLGRSLMMIALAYMVSSVISWFCSWRDRGSSNFILLKSYFFMSIWALALAAIYWIFFAKPSVEPIVLISSQVLAPFVSVLVVGKEKTPNILQLVQYLALTLSVVFIASFGSPEWLSTVLVLILFMVTQICLRHVSFSEATISRKVLCMSGFASVTLLFFSAAYIGELSFSLDYVWKALLLGVGLYFVQSLYLYGISESNDHDSALILGFSVPIALAIDVLSGGGIPVLAVICMSVFVLISLFRYAKSRRFHLF